MSVNSVECELFNLPEKRWLAFDPITVKLSVCSPLLGRAAFRFFASYYACMVIR
jgi:hypothetical protein